jgi:hypothetical protein
MSKKRIAFEHVGGRVYRAMTGLENANGARVEQGEIVPNNFVSDEQLQHWLAQRDVMMVFEEMTVTESSEVNDGGETR